MSDRVVEASHIEERVTENGVPKIWIAWKEQIAPQLFDKIWINGQRYTVEAVFDWISHRTVLVAIWQADR